MPSTKYRYLTNIPGIRSGRTIIEGTRIGVHDVVGLIVNGSSIDDVCRSFPDVTRAQVYECLAYYEDHRPEIDTMVAEQMSDDLPVTFFFDHDVPHEVALMLRHREHEVILLRDVLPITSTDAEVFAYACEQNVLMVTCNRNDFLELAAGRKHSGLIILIRRRTHQIEAAHLFKLIENAGEAGLRGNINFA